MPREEAEMVARSANLAAGTISRAIRWASGR